MLELNIHNWGKSYFVIIWNRWAALNFQLPNVALVSNECWVWTVCNNTQRFHVAFVRLHWWQLTESLRATNNDSSSPLWLSPCNARQPLTPTMPAAATCCPRWRHCTTEASDTAWRICSTACCTTADCQLPTDQLRACGEAGDHLLCKCISCISCPTCLQWLLWGGARCCN